MKLMFVSNLYPPEVLGGYEILCARVAAAFVARGHEVRVLTTGRSGTRTPAMGAGLGDGPGSGAGTGRGLTQASDIERGPAGETILRSLHLFLPFGEQASLARADRQAVEKPNRNATLAALDGFRPDIVFVWSQLRLGLAAARAAEAAGYPTAYTMNDDHVLGFMPGTRGGIKGAIRSIVEDLIYPASTWKGLRMDPVIAISETVRSRLAGADPRFAAARIAMQGIPLELFPPKREPGSVHRPFRVLYAGQIHRYKGVHTLVEAVSLAGPKDFSLTVAGAGDPAYEAGLKARSAELGLDAHFTGRVAADAMGALYRDADALAFTSVWDEPFGLTHLEAMASGTPVTSVDHGGPGEFLVDGENALLFKKEDAKGLASCLRRFREDEVLRRRIALAGRATVEAEFTIDRYADRLEALLAETVSGRSRT